MNDLHAVLWIARKDLLQEARSKAVTVATVFFSAVTLGVLAFAFGENPLLMREGAMGALWVALAFAGVISAAQSWQADLEDGALEALLAWPVPRAAVYLGKLLANWGLMTALGFVLLPLAGGLYGAAIGGNGETAPALVVAVLLGTIAAGTLGFALIAVFYAGLTANLRARESLLPVLMFPVVVPILLAAVRASNALVGSGDLDLAWAWLRLLVGFDLVYAVVCLVLFRFVVEA
ncbi:MAG: heme exporter protein CcmB [Trueperaceae bacterium]|nr:heme exporter protein CcmB [Trueperaceae bacterium]